MGVVDAGLPNENPPNGLGFAAPAVGAGAAGAGVVEAPNENPADGADGAVDEACPKEKEPNGEAEVGAAAGVGIEAYAISVTIAFI